jgi:integrase
MKGVKKYGPNKWRIRWDGSIDELTGKRRQLSKVVTGSKTDAEKFLRARQVDLDNDAVEVDRQITVRSISTSWLNEMEGSVRDHTLRTYRTLIESYVIPALGDRKAASVTPDSINKLKRRLNETNGRRTGKPIGAQTQLHVLRALSMVFDHAIRHELIVRNPVKAVRKPTVLKERVKTVPIDVIPRILDWLNRHSEASVLPTLVSAMTGMRRGEVLGLKWSDLHIENDEAYLTVQRSLVQSAQDVRLMPTKTAASNRRVELPYSLIHPLIEWRAKLANVYQVNQNDTSGFVFGDPIRKNFPLMPESVSQAFKRAAIACDLPGVSFHALRHTYASALLERGEHPLVVSTNLGHSDVQVTLNTYSHVTPQLQRRAADAMDSVLGAQIVANRELAAVP